MKNKWIFVFGLFMTLGAFASEKFKMIHTDTLATMMEDKANPVFIFDANNEKVRGEYGTIPGSKLLASSKEYDLKELPSDKKSNLVFFCANTQCMASHNAAKRAMGSGYTNVSVFTDGIMGWKKAGKTTVAVK